MGQRMYFCLITLVLATCLVTTIPLQAEDLQGEIAQLIDEYFEYRNNGRFEIFERFYTPDVVVVTSGGISKGRDKFKESIARSFAGQRDRTSPVLDLSVDQMGETVRSTFLMDTRYVRKSNGEAVHRASYITFLFKKIGERWMCFHVQSTARSAR